MSEPVTLSASGAGGRTAQEEAQRFIAEGLRQLDTYDADRRQHGYRAHGNVSTAQQLFRLAAEALASTVAVNETLGEAVEVYMRESMAMPDSQTDQEQNWIAGHLFTFAHRQLAAQASHEPATASGSQGEK